MTAIDDLRELARLADDVVGHSPDRVAQVHRRIDRARWRRRASAVAAAVVAAGALAAASLALGDLAGRTPHPADSNRPAPGPTRSESERPPERFHPKQGATRLTPRQTVLSYNAVLLRAVAAFDDPDVRVSLWESVCWACLPCSECRSHPSFRALALTTDGYRTTTYLRPRQVNVQSITRAAGHAFLLNDELNARQRLLTPDGRLRPVRMVDEQRGTKDPGLVFECDRNLTDPVIGYDKGESGWCVLDVRSSTASPLPATWVVGRSMARPALGQRPWGIEYVYSTETGPLDGYDRAWWADSGPRRYAELPQTGLLRPVASLSDDDTPTYLNWPLWSDRMDVYVARQRLGALRKVASRPWLPLTRAEMGEAGHPKELGIDAQFARTPDGGLLAWSYRELTTRPGLTIWRADSLTDGSFETVYDGGRQTIQDPSRLGLDLAVHDGRIYLDTLVSGDDGRTWTEPVTNWRP